MALWGNQITEFTPLSFQQDLRTYVAPDLEQLQRRIDNKESVWCGWDRFFGASDTECVTRISPFGQTLVAVADAKGTQRLQSGASTNMQPPQRWSIPRHNRHESHLQHIDQIARLMQASFAALSDPAGGCGLCESASDGWSDV